MDVQNVQAGANAGGNAGRGLGGGFTAGAEIAGNQPEIGRDGLGHGEFSCLSQARAAPSFPGRPLRQD